MKWHKPSVKMIIYLIIHSNKIRLISFCSQQTEKSKSYKTLENIHNHIHWHLNAALKYHLKSVLSVIIKITFPDRCVCQICISLNADSLMAQVHYVPFDRQTSVEMHTRTVRSSIRGKKFKNVLKFQPRESNYRNTNSQSMLKVMSIKSQDGSCCFVNKVRLLKGHQCRNAVLAVQ